MAVETDVISQYSAALDNVLALISPGNPFYINKIVGKTLKSTFFDAVEIQGRTINDKVCDVAVLDAEGDMGTAALKTFSQDVADKALYLKQVENEGGDRDLHFCVVLDDPQSQCLIYFYQNQHEVDTDNESIIYHIEIVDSSSFTNQDRCAFVTDAAIRFSNILIYTSIDLINATIANFNRCNLNLTTLAENILSKFSVETYLSFRRSLSKNLYRDAMENHLLAKRILKTSHGSLDQLDDLIVSVKTDGKVINYDFQSAFFSALVDVDVSGNKVEMSSKVDNAPDGFDLEAFTLSIKDAFTLDTLHRYDSTGEAAFTYYDASYTATHRITP